MKVPLHDAIVGAKKSVKCLHDATVGSTVEPKRDVRRSSSWVNVYTNGFSRTADSSMRVHTLRHLTRLIDLTVKSTISYCLHGSVALTVVHYKYLVFF